MQYREIGRTRKKAGIIGLGCEHMDGMAYGDVEHLIHAALDSGINYLDCFMPGKDIREKIAGALGPRRKDVFIQGHFGSTDLNQQYDVTRDLPTAKRHFEELLRIFGYIDFGMLFFIDTEEDFKEIMEGGAADYLQKLRQNGDIGHIGFGSHNPVVAKKIVDTGLPEVMMFSINAAFDLCPPDADVLDALAEDRLDGSLSGLDPVRVALYKSCEQRGVGISVMKALGAGKLISAQHTPFSKPMTVNQCLHYALSRPAVFSALVGCSSTEQIEQAISYLEANDAEKDYTPYLSELKTGFLGQCVYCNHCLPCPVEINIAAVNKYLDIAKLDEGNISPSIRSHYNGLAHSGADCIACGSCEKRCPFDVPVIHNMEKAAALFS